MSGWTNLTDMILENSEALGSTMEHRLTTKTDAEHLTVADFDASAGANPDPNGDFASGRTRVFLDAEEFLAYLDHCHGTAAEE